MKPDGSQDAIAAPAADSQPRLPPSKSSGAALIELLIPELGFELGVKASLESRGISVIWTSASMVSILAAITSVGAGELSAGEPHWSFLVAALAFLAALVGGMIANWTHKYEWLNLEDIAQIVESPQYMREPSTFIERRIAAELVKQLKAANEGNAKKALAVKVGIVAELIAVAALAVGLAGTFI